MPHNLYFLLLAETGFLGVAAFAFFMVGAIAVALRSLRRLDAAWRSVTAGLMIGILALLGHMMTDFAVWLDPILFTLAVVVGMIANATSVAEDIR